jgi:hypothetical protein
MDSQEPTIADLKKAEAEQRMKHLAAVERGELDPRELLLATAFPDLVRSPLILDQIEIPFWFYYGDSPEEAVEI